MCFLCDFRVFSAELTGDNSANIVLDMENATSNNRSAGGSTVLVSGTYPLRGICMHNKSLNLPLILGLNSVDISPGVDTLVRCININEAFLR